MCMYMLQQIWTLLLMNVCSMLNAHVFQFDDCLGFGRGLGRCASTYLCRIVLLWHKSFPEKTTTNKKCAHDSIQIMTVSDSTQIDWPQAHKWSFVVNTSSTFGYGKFINGSNKCKTRQWRWSNWVLGKCGVSAHSVAKLFFCRSGLSTGNDDDDNGGGRGSGGGGGGNERQMSKHTKGKER